MATTTWTLDPLHSELGFRIKHLMIANVSGTFRNFSVEMQTEGEDLTTATIRLTADLASIHTNNEQRDAHLRNSDFFDVAHHPQLEFRSTRVEKIDNESYRVSGELTMKGITKPVVLGVEYSGPTKDPWGGERAGFVVTGKIRRSEWGIAFNAVLETGGVALSDEVKIQSDLQLLRNAVSAVA